MIEPRKAVMEMKGYNPPTSGRENYLKLDFNENTQGCPYSVIKSLRRIKGNSLSYYPEYTKLRKALAKYCKIKPENVIPTNGTDEAIKTIIETYIEKGRDEIIIPVPTYAMFKFYAQLSEALIKEVKYNNDLSFPANKVLQAITKKTKLIILANPNNPTGTSICKKDIIKILQKAKRNGAAVLLDEAYWQFIGKTYTPLIERYGNLLITGTFSKVFGLAGLRLGYIISDKSNIKTIAKVISPYSVNAMASVCAIEAVKNGEYAVKYANEVKNGKYILYKELKNLGIKYYESDANFVLLKIGQKSPEFCKKMMENGILVRDRSNDPLLRGCVRITVGTPNQTKQLVKALRTVIKQINPLLIFDIDGVLVDISKSYIKAIRKTCKYFTGKNISAEGIKPYKMKGGFNNEWNLTEAIIKDRGKGMGKKKIIEKFQGYYNRLKNKEKWLLNKKILKILSNRYYLAILTGRPRKESYYVLKRNNVVGFFKAIISMEDVSRQKPDPEGLIKILKIFPNSEAYYFGDSVDDTKAAVSAGIKSIGVLPPQDKSTFLSSILKKYGAKSVISSINNLTEALK